MPFQDGCYAGSSYVCLLLTPAAARSSILRVDIGARTDVGRKREHNEDCYCVLRETGLFIVSDGIGGQAKGEVASALAVVAVIAHCQQRGVRCGPLQSESRF